MSSLEEALHEEREWLHVTLTSIGDAVITTDTQGAVTFVNPVAQSLTGWAQEQAVGAPLEAVFRIVDEDTGVAVENPAVRALRDGVAIRLANHTMLTAKEGRQCPIDYSAGPIRDAKGEVAGVVLVFRDITERRQHEQAVQIALNYAENIIATLREPFIVLTEDLLVKMANRSFYETFRISPAEVENQFLYDLGNGQWDVPALRALLKDVLSDHHSIHNYEVEHNFQTIGPKIMRLNAVRLSKPANHSDMILLSIEDITERSRLERQTREQAEALADLHRRKDEFLAMLSHELRNPLSPILNAVHLLKVQPDESPLQVQARTVIERQVGQLTALINDLLEISRISTGRIQLHLERLDIRGVVNLAVESVQPLIARRKHQLSLSVPSEPVWLQADPARLEQVVVNLLNNAAKYTDEGGRIRLTVQQEGDQVVLRVRDSGVGIAGDLLPRIFDLFAQADRSLDRSQGGLGIGLSLAQRLVELHRGTIEAHSEGLGKGSEFSVRFPVLLSEAVQLPAASTETVEQPEPAGRVLVVDDSVDAADTIALILEVSGYEVRTAYTAQTALEAAIAYRPTIVLLDIGLPDMDGYEVARRLRQHPEMKQVQLVALTGYGQQSDRQLSEEAGFDYHMVKPIDPEKLQELLATLAKYSKD
jgi:PAS domain S-box-containing protein